MLNLLVHRLLIFTMTSEFQNLCLRHFYLRWFRTRSFSREENIQSTYLLGPMTLLEINNMYCSVCLITSTRFLLPRHFETLSNRQLWYYCIHTAVTKSFEVNWYWIFQNKGVHILTSTTATKNISQSNSLFHEINQSD